MIIRKEHAVILEELLNRRETTGHTIPPEKMNEAALNELIIAGLLRKLTHSNWLLTYHGARLAEALNQLTQNTHYELPQKVEKGEEVKNILEHHKLTHPSQWTDSFRFLGSEIILIRCS